MSDLTICRFCFDDEPDQFFLTCIVPIPCGGKLHDLVAGPYATREAADAARERMQLPDIDPIARFTEGRAALLAGRDQ